MKCIVLPYGNAVLTEKERILGGVIASRQCPPFIYNDVLILVHSSRMKRMYGKLFLELAEQRGSRALVQPEVQTLHLFLEKLYARCKGSRLIDENSRLVLLEGLVKERLTSTVLFDQSPDLLAPSLSAALAKMIEQLSTAGVSPGDLSLKIKDADCADKPQVKLLLDLYARYAAVLEEQDLTDPAGVRAWLRDNFDPAWLAPYREIIIDGIQGAGSLEADILKKIATCGNCTFLVDAPSAGLLECAGEFHPLRGTRDLLARMGLSPEPAGTTADPSELFLAQALFSDKPFSEAAQNAPQPISFGKDIRRLSAINTREEVSLIAGMVKRSLRAGTTPDTILVAFPALDVYGPLVEELFIDYGIPYNRALGRQLSTSPVAAAVIALLRACQEDFSGPSLLRIFSSAFLKFGENPAIAPALDRLMRDRRIIGSREKLLAALAHHSHGEGTDVLSEPLKDLFRATDPFCTTDSAPLSAWMDRLGSLLSWSGLGPRVNMIHGPLNINLQAYKKLNDTLASLSAAGKLFPAYRYSLSEWLFLLKRTFMHARFQVPPDDEGGVQVLGLEESAGRPWQEIYLGGLVDSAFPQRLPQNIFLPESTLEALGVRTLEKARLNAAHHFYRLLLSADRVTLTYPENEGDRPVVPSPFLEELTPLTMAGLINRDIETTSGIQSSLKIEDSNSISELAKAISLSTDVKGVRDILNADITGMTGIRSAFESKPEASASSVLVQPKRSFSVTELDDYLSCPYTYYVRHVLGIEPLEEATEDLSPLDRGSKVHSILRNFYLSWSTEITRDNRNETRALLAKLADSAFGKEADTFRNRREKELFKTMMTERFLDAEEVFWKQGMKPVSLEQKIESFKLVLSSGTVVELKGTIDRIDADEDGDFIIVDYKTGVYPLPKMGGDQVIFQLPVYAVMARETLGSGSLALRRPIGLAYYDLAGKNKGSARDVVLFNKDLRDDHPATKPKASPRPTAEFEAILEQSLDKARNAIEGILAGTFASAPQDESTCRYCPHETMCGKIKL